MLVDVIHRFLTFGLSFWFAVWFDCGFSWCWLCVYDVDMNLGVFVVVCCGFLVLVVFDWWVCGICYVYVGGC